MIKNINKKALSLAMAGVTFITIPTFTSCSKKNEEGFYSISQDRNEFNKYKKIIIKDGEAQTVYYGENIVLTVDKSTFELKEYIASSGTLDILDNIYDLRNEELLVYKSKYEVENYTYSSKGNYNKLIDNKYIIPFKDIGDYVEGETLKKYYTLDEIEKLELEILDSIRKISEYEKVKKIN